MYLFIFHIKNHFDNMKKSKSEIDLAIMSKNNEGQ
jgi:hypothetical protein